MSQLTGNIVPTFQEVYTNLQTLDETKAEDTKVNDILTDITFVETSPATAAHTENEYIIHDNCLYKVMEDIAVGDAIRPGINVKRTSICDELNIFSKLMNELTKYRVVMNASTNRLGLYYDDDNTD